MTPLGGLIVLWAFYRAVMERFGKIFRRRLRRQLSRLKQWLLSAKLILG
jgi:hypothetical protein